MNEAFPSFAMKATYAPRKNQLNVLYHGDVRRDLRIHTRVQSSLTWTYMKLFRLLCTVMRDYGAVEAAKLRMSLHKQVATSTDKVSFRVGER